VRWGGGAPDGPQASQYPGSSSDGLGEADTNDRPDFPPASSRQSRYGDSSYIGRSDTGQSYADLSASPTPPAAEDQWSR
jgi:hypothetical protein